MDAKAEVIQKVAALVGSVYGGDFAAAFNEFDQNIDGRINGEELAELLSEAGVGNRLTRSAWVRGVIQEMDTDHDQCISWGEFQAAIGVK